MSGDDNGVERRSVLKHVAAGTAALTGASGIVDADTGPAVRERVSQDYVDEYADVGTVRSMLGERSEILETLSEKGVLERASADAVSLDRVAAGRPREASEGTVAVSEHVASDGETTLAAIHVRLESDDERARITLVPELDNALVVTSPTGDDPFDAIDNSVLFDATLGDCTRCCYRCNVLCYRDCCDCNQSCCL